MKPSTATVEVHLRWHDDEAAEVAALYRSIITLTDVDVVAQVTVDGDIPEAD